MFYIGIDLGGTNIAVGIVNVEGKIIAKDQISTGLPCSPEVLTERISTFVRQMLERNGITAEEVSGGGIGIPGTVNSENGVVEYANNFDFIQVPLTEMLNAQLPFPIYALNDAAAAALGEYKAGAGAGSRSMIMVTLGTGVGGGIILDGKIIGGYNNAAGEVGHMVIKQGGRLCTCGRRGCLETYASATALVHDAKRMASKYPSSMLYKCCEGRVGELNGRQIFEAVRAGDETACKVLEQFTDYLSEGLANLINIFQPEMVCIGGGISGAGELLMTPVIQKTMPLLYSRNSEKNAKIVAAELGNDAGIIGAALNGM